MQRCRDIVEQPAYERLGNVRMANGKAFGLQPVQVGAPLDAGQLSAGDHDQGLRREARQVLLAEPAIERLQPFVGVDEDCEASGVRAVNLRERPVRGNSRLHRAGKGPR